MTGAEWALWRMLSDRQLSGFKFRRQQPIRHYIVDFVCFSHKLVIEVDGSQHANVTEYDRQRTLFLNREGFRVLRFWNNEVLQNREGVCEMILEELSLRHPSPRPSPTRGEGEG